MSSFFLIQALSAIKIVIKYVENVYFCNICSSFSAFVYHDIQFVYMIINHNYHGITIPLISYYVIYVTWVGVICLIRTYVCMRTRSA